MSNEIEHVKCLIIGSGPAGYTAAIYAARADMKPVLYQGMQPGGQLTETTEVDNFPGYPQGINGPQMMIDLQKQAERFDTDVRSGWVTKVNFSGDVHTIEMDNGAKTMTADTVIISTGASAKWLGLESEIRLRDMGGGVSACAVAHLLAADHWRSLLRRLCQSVGLASDVLLVSGDCPCFDSACSSAFAGKKRWRRSDISRNRLHIESSGFIPKTASSPVGMA